MPRQNSRRSPQPASKGEKLSRRLLLLSPAFFGYERDIQEALESNGVIVDFHDERPSNSSLAKGAFRVGGRFARWLVKSYYKKILTQSKHREYDIVLVIKGEVVPKDFLQQLRRQNPTAHFVYYSFDSIRPGSNSAAILNEFDALYSFDPRDVALYEGMKLKHLFYSQEFVSDKALSERKYGLAFIGTLHSDRFAFVSNLAHAFECTYIFFFVQARWYFVARKLLRQEFLGVRSSDVSFRKLDKPTVAAVFQDSFAVLDIQRTNQTGLTMRTFEVLASGAVLVTANPAIRDTDFYDPSRIVVIDEYESTEASEKLKLRLSRIVRPDRPLPNFDKYAVTNWVREFIA